MKIQYCEDSNSTGCDDSLVLDVLISSTGFILPIFNHKWKGVAETVCSTEESERFSSNRFVDLIRWIKKTKCLQVMIKNL